MADNVEDRERRHRLELLDAAVAAMDRRDEVLQAIADAEDADEALSRVRELLGISEGAAHGVLNLQWRRLTRLDRARMQQDRDDVAQGLVQLP